MKTSNQIYKTELSFQGRQCTVLIKINQPKDEEGGYHYDLELRTKEKISGNEFQKLKKYLETEGYIDAAIEYLEKQH